MSRREGLLALAERCEQASEGGVDLDADIVWGIVCDDDRKVFDGVRHVVAMVGPQGPWFLPLSDRAQDAPCFTRSLDAALALVPAGMRWKTGRASEGRFYGYVQTKEWHTSEAATPALALAAAALRARAAKEDGHGA